MIYNVTYYLKIRNAISIYSISYILPLNVKLVVKHYKALTTLLVIKNYIKSEKI